MSDLSAEGYDCLRRAVTLSREGGAKTVFTLRRELTKEGYSRQHIDEAIKAWAERVRR